MNTREGKWPEVSPLCLAKVTDCDQSCFDVSSMARRSERRRACRYSASSAPSRKKMLFSAKQLSWFSSCVVSRPRALSVDHHHYPWFSNNPRKICLLMGQQGNVTWLIAEGYSPWGFQVKLCVSTTEHEFKLTVTLRGQQVRHSCSPGAESLTLIHDSWHLSLTFWAFSDMHFTIILTITITIGWIAIQCAQWAYD